MSQSHTFTVIKGSPSGALSTSETTRQLRPTDAYIELTHCGLCGTDLHYVKAGMGLGHEGVGIIRALGPATSAVSDLKVGDRVGMGWIQKYCGRCRYCLTGVDMYCENQESYGGANTDEGFFATGGCWDVSALHKVPDALESEAVGPLMCGGATVWGPLYQHGVKAGMRIGVVGLGGLGHLAVQFASKMGMEVVVFSGTEEKKAEATGFGASEFVTTKGKKSFEGVAPIDFLLITTSQQPDYDLYLPIMSHGGKIFPLTVSFGTHPIPMLPILVNGISIQGSAGAHRQSIKDMLDFAAKHHVRPKLQLFGFGPEPLQEAMDVLEKGGMRYRGVIEIQK